MDFLTTSPRRIAAAVAGCVAVALSAGVAPASASHLKGGSLSAAISATDQLTVNVKWLQADGGCQVGTSTFDPPLTIEAPDGTTRSPNVTLPVGRCAGATDVIDAATTIDLTDPVDGFGANPPAGVYKVKLSSCCRVGGIMNASGGNVSLEATVRRVPGTATASPRYIGATAAGASQGFLYTGDVTAVDDAAGDLAYNLLQGASSGQPLYDADAPQTNVVSLAGTEVTVPAATTAGWALGSYFAYKTDVAAADGEHSLLDMLVKVTNNRSPVFDAVPQTFEVTAGQTATLPLTANDPDTGDTVTISAGAIPGWAAFSQTAGNPAQGSLVLTPPVGTEGTFLFPIDASDDNSDAFLQDTRIVRVHVSAPKAETPAAAPTPAAPAATPATTPVATPAAAPVPLKAVKIVSGKDGVATLTLTVPGPGKIDIKGIGRVNKGGKGAGGGYLIASTSAAKAKKPLTLFAKTKAVYAAGTLSVDFKLQRKSIRDLAERGLLRVDLTATYTPLDGGKQLTASKSLRLKAFTVMSVGEPQLLDDGHRLRLTVRVPRAGKLWSKVSADHDGGRVTLGRTTARPVRRGEAVLDLDVSSAEAQHVLSGTVVPLHLTAVLDAKGGKRQTRTRTVNLRTK